MSGFERCSRDRAGTGTPREAAAARRPLRMRPRLATGAWNPGLEPRLDHRARFPDRSKSLPGNTVAPAAPRPGGRLADRPAGDASTLHQTPRGTRDAAKPPDACLTLCRSPGVPRRGRVLIRRRRPSVFASRSLHRHRPRI